jgi:hypothetical protein
MFYLLRFQLFDILCFERRRFANQDLGSDSHIVSVCATVACVVDFLPHHRCPIRPSLSEPRLRSAENLARTIGRKCSLYACRRIWNDSSERAESVASCLAGSRGYRNHHLPLQYQHIQLGKDFFGIEIESHRRCAIMNWNQLDRSTAIESTFQH